MTNVRCVGGGSIGKQAVTKESPCKHTSAKEEKLCFLSGLCSGYSAGAKGNLARSCHELLRWWPDSSDESMVLRVPVTLTRPTKMRINET
jgi:hypothetical protein